MDQAKLKYRIVGGIVLLALAAILVPVLNDMRQPQPLGPQAIDIPAEPSGGIASDLPVDAPPLEGKLPEPQDIPPPGPPPPLSEDGTTTSPDEGGELAPAPAPESPKPALPVAGPAPLETPPSSRPVAKPVIKPAPVPASKPLVVKPAPTPVAKPAATARPAPMPAPVVVKPVPTPPSESAAKPAAPAVATSPPAVVPAPTSTPTPAASGQQAWVVQLGVYGNLKTAIDLREQLRKAGHSAFTEEIATPHGKALRVRVGPELDRATAQAVRDRLARETGHDGIVVTYP